MSETDTRQTLLIRLREPDDAEAWRDFSGLYMPLLKRFVMLRGVPAQDVDDVVQEVLTTVAKAIRKFDYDPARGTFRDWLFVVCRSHVFKWMRRNASVPGMTSMDGTEVPAPEEQQDWDSEYRRQMFSWASERVRPTVHEKTWQAFWMTAVENRSSSDVASLLGMSIGAVYVAKSRVISRMREEIARASGDTLDLK